jgi:hypothetical protein
MRAHKLALTGKPDDGDRLDEFCGRLEASDIEDDAAMEKAAQMIASVVVSCAAIR